MLSSPPLDIWYLRIRLNTERMSRHLSCEGGRGRGCPRGGAGAGAGEGRGRARVCPPSRGWAEAEVAEAAGARAGHALQTGGGVSIGVDTVIHHNNVTHHTVHCQSSLCHASHCHNVAHVTSLSSQLPDITRLWPCCV